MSGALRALACQAARDPSAMALDDGAQRLSYGGLAGRVGFVAASLRLLPLTVGLLAPHGLDWAIGELAIEAAGRTFVPLPDFFSDAQLRHVLADSGVSAALVAPELAPRATSLGVLPIVIASGEAALPEPPSGSAARIVYTSGSTGTPKGVRLGARQLAASCEALRLAVKARADDLHLSALPYALLLESLCGLRLPLLVGACVRIVGEAARATPTALPALLARVAREVRPSTSVLTPQLLAAWVAALEAGLGPAPDSLRFVAVGGAATPEPLLRRAKAQGLPAFQGYGLTECGSVVAANRPGADRLGSCGRPLPGVDVQIADDGEIVVKSPSLMDGYLGAADDPPVAWRTGDLGELDADGYLWVRGRRDSLIVLPNGRNVSPEWVETMLLADPGVARAALTQAPDGVLLALIEPAHAGGAAAIDLHALLAAAPAYARPLLAVWLEPGGFAARGLLTPNGRPRRAALRAFIESVREG